MLAELTATWAGQGGLDTLVDAVEAMLLAEDAADRRTAASDFGGTAAACTAAAMPNGGRRWGLLWGASVQTERVARDLLAAAHNCAPPPRSIFRSKPRIVDARPLGRSHRPKQRRTALAERRIVLFRLGLTGR